LSEIRFGGFRSSPKQVAGKHQAGGFISALMHGHRSALGIEEQIAGPDYGQGLKRSRDPTMRTEVHFLMTSGTEAHQEDEALRPLWGSTCHQRPTNQDATSGINGKGISFIAPPGSQLQPRATLSAEWTIDPAVWV
jgi:hypothetical protein